MVYSKGAAGISSWVPLVGCAVYVAWEKGIPLEKLFGCAITAAENSGYKFNHMVLSLIKHRG